MKPCMASPMTPWHLTWDDLERLEWESLRFWSRISRKGAELSHTFLLTINGKPYMENRTPPSHLTLGDNELRSILRSLVFQSLTLRKGTRLGPMLLLIINRKPYLGISITPWRLTLGDLEKSKSRTLSFQALYPIKELSSATCYY